MKKPLFTLVAFMLFWNISYGQEVKVIKFPDLEILLQEKHDEIRIINFWATWCKPCVMEMPYFEKLNYDQAFPDVNVIFISLDFIENLDSKVRKFIIKNGIQSDMYLLDDIDYNSWINKVDKNWSGAIPATLIIDGKTGKREFHEAEFSEGELEKIVKDFKTSI